MTPHAHAAHPEPSNKRTVAFFDGQNLFNAAKSAFGYTFPNYNPLALATRVCATQGWSLAQVRFYTGMPSAAEDPGRHMFWTNKLVALRRDGVHVFTRNIRYRDRVTRWPGSVRIRLPNGAELPAGTTLHRADGSPLPASTEFRVRSADDKGRRSPPRAGHRSPGTRRRLRRRFGVLTGPGSVRSGRRDPAPRPNAAAVDSDRVRLPG